MNTKTKIYHLYHSGVAVVKGNLLLIFDYYNDKTNGKKRNLQNGVISKKDIKQKNTYVFVSHSHSDHFNPVIFNWENEVKNIKYILSSDISYNKKGNNHYYIEKDEEITFKDLSVKTFGSTDKGVSYLVKTENKNIFHAGDLNWWYWKSFSEKKQKIEERDYKREVNKIKGEKIDIAFIPVDPRLDEYYYLAGEYFARKIKPEIIVPIHFGNRYEITEKFARKLNSSDVKVITISNREENCFVVDGDKR